MKETKRRLELYSFYDRTGLERHLARMAEKGWMLDKIDGFGWRYRRIEPKKLTFSVCYFPKASQFDPEPSEEQQTFYDFCAHTGWMLAAASAQLQVFYNERENPVPIDTDPVTEVDAIHRSVKRSALPSQLALLAISTLNAALLVWRLVDDPIGILASAGNLAGGICWTIMFLCIVVEWGSYFLWHRKAVLAAEHGEFLETRSHRPLQIGCLIALAVVAVYLLAAVFTSGNRLLMTVMALVFCLYVPAAFLLVFGIKGMMKRMKASAKVNLTVTLAGSFALSLVIIGIITFGTIRAYNSGWLSRGRETYEYDGRTYTLRRPRPLGRVGGVPLDTGGRAVQPVPAVLSEPHCGDRHGLGWGAHPGADVRCGPKAGRLDCLSGAGRVSPPRCFMGAERKNTEIFPNMGVDNSPQKGYTGQRCKKL